MNTAIQDKDLSKFLAMLVGNSNDLLQISGWYCIAQWVHQYAAGWNRPVRPPDIAFFLHADQYSTVLKLCELNLFQIEENAEALAHLVGVIRHYNMTGVNARYFYRDFLCCSVADTSYFSWQSSVTSDGALCCTLIHLCMLYAGDRLGTKKIIEVQSPMIYDAHLNTMKWFGISLEEFERCWDAVHYCDVSSPYKARPKIKDAVKIYDKYHASKRFLLEQYAVASGFDPRELRLSENPLEYIQKRSGQKVREGGLTDEDKLFLNAAYQISRETPTDIVHTLFYADRDDSNIECMVARTEIMWAQWCIHDLLIVNPSPMFLLEYSRVEGMKQEGQVAPSRTTFAVMDDTLCCIYGRQFPQYHFIRIDQMVHLTQQYDFILVFARDYDDRNDLWKAYRHCKDSGHMAALVPQTAITKKGETFVEELFANKIHVRLLMGVPENLRQSAPKKKVLLCGRKNERFSEKMRLINAVADETGNWLVLEKKSYHVSMDLLKRGMTLAQMIKVAQNKTSKPRENEYYFFSKEILIEYIKITKKKCLVGIKASYRTIYRPKVNVRSSKGTRTVKDYDRGLRGSSMGMILPKLQLAVLSEAFSPAIIEDIKDYYKNDLGCLSIKTMWYCCREALSYCLSYDEDIAMEFFCGEYQELSNLQSGYCVADDIVRAMAVLYGEIEIPKKKWLQLNLIFQTAIEEGLIEKNPLASFMLIVKDKFKERLYMLSAALKKSHFTEDEELRMIEFLRERIPVPRKKGDTAPRYVVESKWLAAAFSLFAGLPVREICPLLWGDLRKIEDDLEEMQVYITKHLNDQGIVISNLNYKNKEKYRKAALDMILIGMLLERLQYIKTLYGLTDDDLQELPIMLEAEPFKGRSIKQAKMLSRATAVAVKKKLLEEAKIEEEWISLLEGDQKFDYNLNAYRTDLFAANFRHKAYNYCGFRAGELCYHLGNKGPDTYSVHYCDYGDDFVQYGMVRKLNRWTYIYEPKNNRIKTSFLAEVLDDQKEYTTGFYAQGRASATATVTPSENAEGSVIVEVECRHGLEGSATTYERGEHDNE